MKSMRYMFSFLVADLLFLNFASAQEAVTDTLPESAYHIEIPKHVVNIYSDFVPYILFGIVIALMLYVSYRYWHDNLHTPHHQ